MSDSISSHLVVKDFGAAHDGAELFSGDRNPSNGDVAPTFSYDYLRERFAISSVLVARTVGSVVAEDETVLGYRFNEEAPASVTSVENLESWVQQTCHAALDSLIETNQTTYALAQRYQDLVRPTAPKGQEPSADDRRDTLLFSGAVFEPHALLRIASVVARYNGKRILPEQAVPFALASLHSIQQEAKRDVAPQRIRSAILEAATELGEMHSPGNPMDRDMRYQLLRAYVAEQTGHTLAANRFGNLYSVKDHPDQGITLAERPEGFGRIKPMRDIPPLGCPASYRLQNDKDRGVTVDKSALYKLLRACINSMARLSLFEESLHTERTEVPIAYNHLSTKLIASGKYI